MTLALSERDEKDVGFNLRQPPDALPRSRRVLEIAIPERGKRLRARVSRMYFEGDVRQDAQGTGGRIRRLIKNIDEVYEFRFGWRVAPENAQRVRKRQQAMATREEPEAEHRKQALLPIAAHLRRLGAAQYFAIERGAVGIIDVE